jgi:tRNA 5-methylaminomethyl-2-thiouridine biosynthesis bifunctional protein
VTTPASRLPPEPDIRFDDTGLIMGEAFNDSYFSRDDGLEETRKVFLEGCGLPEAWVGQASFTIAELGFGTGLNVLATWDLWRRHRQPGQTLHFITTEAFLMAAEHAAKAHARAGLWQPTYLVCGGWLLPDDLDRTCASVPASHGF